MGQNVSKEGKTRKSKSRKNTAAESLKDKTFHEEGDSLHTNVNKESVTPSRLTLSSFNGDENQLSNSAYGMEGNSFAFDRDK